MPMYALRASTGPSCGPWIRKEDASLHGTYCARGGMGSMPTQVPPSTPWPKWYALKLPSIAPRSFSVPAKTWYWAFGDHQVYPGEDYKAKCPCNNEISVVCTPDAPTATFVFQASLSVAVLLALFSYSLHLRPRLFRLNFLKKLLVIAKITLGPIFFSSLWALPKIIYVNTPWKWPRVLCIWMLCKAKLMPFMEMLS